MPGKTIGATLLALAACGLAGWSQSNRGGLAGPALDLGLRGQAELTREERFTTKAQASGGVSVRGELPLWRVAALGLGVDGHGTLGSSLEGGWQYRGHLGMGLRLYGRLRLPLAVSWGGRLLYLGGATGASLNYDRYVYTQLHFFYPGWFLEPQMELQLRPAGRSSLALLLPIDVYFRKDLELSTAAGLGISWRLYARRIR
jgi:hypothetical protein